MLRIILCDDNEEIIMAYSKMISQIAGKHGLQVRISAFPSGESLCFEAADSPDLADIIYMDIIMRAQNGIETAKELRRLGCRAEIIFLTTIEDYVFEAFDSAPVHYLIKGATTDEKFEQVFLRAASLVQAKEADMFVCEASKTRKVIPVKDISYFEINVRVVTVHYQENEEFPFYATMEELEKQLQNKDFLRVHRSFLVSLPYVAKLGTKSLTLKTGAEIPVGGSYSRKTKEALSAFIAKYHVRDFGYCSTD